MLRGSVCAKRHPGPEDTAHPADPALPSPCVKPRPPASAVKTRATPAAPPAGGCDTPDRRTAPPASARPLPDDFLGQLTHELKTPVSAIRTASFLLRQHGRDLTGPTEQRWIESIQQGCAELSSALAQLDELQRVRQEEPDRGTEARNVRTWLDPLVHELAALHPAAAGRVAVSASAPGRWRFHAILTTAALRPLLANGLKFSPAHGRVELSVKTVPPFGLEFTVTDSGPGVEPEEVERLFTPFFQGRNSRGLPGCGLGLTIARTAALRLGGELGYFRTPDGRTAFRLRVPAAEARARPKRSALQRTDRV